MRKFNIKFVDNLKKYIIVSISIFVVGIVMAVIFGIDLDVSFKGGSRFTYTYSGDIAIADANAAVEAAIGKQVTITESTDITGGSAKLVIALTGDESITTDAQKNITEALQEKFADNKVEFGDANTVNPSIAGSFFAKSIFAVIFAGVIVILYIGFRFRKIGGVSAGVMACVALIHDALIAFFFCIIFRLQIDANFMAVILTIFGYSLNDTVVIYDRIRENERLYPGKKLRDLVNTSINQTLGRTLTTSIATFSAVAIVAVVAELSGITTLRSFAIPMAIGVISGSYSSICLAGPLWVKWSEYAQKRADSKPKPKHKNK